MYEITNDSLRASFSKTGARLIALVTGGVDVVVGPADDANLVANDQYGGSLTGRYAGRITNAQFELEGRPVKLQPNVGSDHLHGGPKNFSNSDWNVAQTDDRITFTIHSPDGDQGYPGALDATATYGLSGKVLWLDISATTTKSTPINLTNHAYWNLAGKGSGLAQELQIDASHYLPQHGAKLPTGEIRAVTGTPFDFRTMRVVGQPYDTTFCLDGKRGEMKHVLTLRDPVSGRSMQVHATESSVQVYTADHFGPQIKGKYGPLAQYDSIAIEPQNYPDAPNHRNFPNSILRPGDTYRHRIEWRF